MYVLIFDISYLTGTHHAEAEVSMLLGISTIRHPECDLLIECSQTRCSQCTKFRKKLQTYLSRQGSTASMTDSTAPDSHVNFRYLSSPEKVQRLQRLHRLQRSTQLQLEKLKKKLASVIEKGSVEVDEVTHKDLKEIAVETTPCITEAFEENSFQRLFWDQQVKALHAKTSKSMRWHPMMVKWCLYLRHLSGKAYEILHESGCVRLPSQRTLRDYTHCIASSAGFSAAVDNHLIDVADVNKCPEYKKNVILIVDEMYIKEDVVYNKSTGSLVGFSNLGDTNSHLLRFQASLENDSNLEELAKTMIVFMVRGLCSSLEFPYAQFPCANLTGDLLFDPLWEAIARLERCGLKVLAVTADGASPNRRLFKIHEAKGSKGVTYKVKNPYATDGRNVFFLSDPPHLMKTVRNCLASKKRSLWVSSIMPLNEVHVRLYCTCTS